MKSDVVEKDIKAKLAREQFSVPMRKGEDYTLRIVDNDYILAFPDDEVKGRVFHFTTVGGVYAQIQDTIAEFAEKKKQRISGGRSSEKSAG